jgi:hypothetical protein
MLSHLYDRGKARLRRQAWLATCLAVLFQLWNEARLILRECHATLCEDISDGLLCSNGHVSSKR